LRPVPELSPVAHGQEPSTNRRLEDDRQDDVEFALRGCRLNDEDEEREDNEAEDDDGDYEYQPAYSDSSFEIC